MNKADLDEVKYIQAISAQIAEITNNFNILSRLAWPLEIREEFFKNNAQVLPRVSYQAFQPDQQLKRLEECRRQLNGSRFDDWLEKNITSAEQTCRMLSNLGKPEFTNYSQALYGYPHQTLKDEKSSSHGLATQLLKLLAPLAQLDLGEPPAACILASTLAERMEGEVKNFGELAPKVLIVDELSANALAGAERIRIRRTACFTDKDIEQLVEHELYVHVATLLNGKQEGNAKLLGSVLPRCTKTQEGLAVFAEFITGTMDIDRLSRLANRVVAIQMAMDGADFIEVYRYFYEITQVKEQAFENARRVFRGGVVEGGAPFTKDIVYLDGLLRVHNFFRSAMMLNKSNVIPMLFSCRMDIEDIGTVCELSKIGLLMPPKFLPKWVKDRRFLLSYLSYSSFLNSIDMQQVNNHYSDILNQLSIE